MSAAYRVRYRGPSGPCPDAIVTFGPDWSEDIAHLGLAIKRSLLAGRAGWTALSVQITAIEYLGPWFDGSNLTPDT